MLAAFFRRELAQLGMGRARVVVLCATDKALRARLEAKFAQEDVTALTRSQAKRFLLLLAPLAAHTAPADKPNILFLFADDQRSGAGTPCGSSRQRPGCRAR